jgi:hypothetical protein
MRNPPDLDLDRDLLCGVNAIARHLHISPATAWRWIASGDLPAFKVKTRIFASKSELRAWFGEHQMAAAVTRRARS